ncbi:MULTISPECIES: acyl-CoA dehydrogenase [unclassified Bradyrhizobium]|uniref:acyl-CoA dehydrogenase n=1 Tax=unclassified Bradyrhizobium TaxID=2631580 RepID=UPI001BAA8E43|nr:MULTISPECIES: acyl-CoA dehydrogenase [unclassified Bradyrhizobium]MBR1202572.1 acyl-CoA dehydrogenase [Bradyrhizobium sp. AUGA SZCCT0124]MBR1310859.1 acyl-CoA dehydrogenase [Bradyrhizobium sp. AUGA SZCCT0051]MBR1339521.1 acyl-CoA dehydrogenase [Bradyrhizobium sp. AUGA SZCCT0105]MBR1354095.1 acyl-CoA dehydrogenase [Bradyrhizobium sp. AUGA SZCCT0045]
MAAIEASNDDVAGMLRDSLRGFLDEHWRPRGATASSTPDEVSTIWRRLVGQGVAALGATSGEGGLAEILVVMAELGRAGCPAPMWSAALANLAIAGSQDDVVVDLLERLHSGKAIVAFSFGALDRDPGAGSVEVTDLKATGVLRFVEAAGGATHLLVVLDQAHLALVDLDGPGVECVATRAMGAWGLSEVRLNAAPFTRIPVGTVDLDDLRIKGKAALTARAYGAARRAFELAADYARERHQFGQPIGKFQAIQHKLVNCLIALEGIRLILEHAARLHDGGDDDWRYFADCASAFSGNALRQVSLETQHTFGAIGYAEEHEAPIHFKRVHLDTIALGGASDAKRRLAERLLDAGGAGLPQYDLGSAGNALREQVRRWLEQNWTGDTKQAFDQRPFAKREFDASFARDIGETGWIGLGWPEQFGGQARSPLEQIAFMETMERGEAPRIGAAIQANALMMFGTSEQQQRYLPEILRGEAMHGMGYSEPQAGSDLAALRTSAMRDGEHWVINGQKIWTTTWWGKYMFLAARTDKDAKPPHAGISMFIVPMDAPGITIRPSVTMYDGTFANIFYDNVRIPAENLVGEVNGGWKVLTGALAFERGLVGGGIVLKVAHAFEQLRLHVIGDPFLADDPLVRDRMATLASEIEIGRLLMMHCAELAADGMTPPEYGAISKVFSGELMERFGEAALDILGMRAALSEQMPGAIDNGRFEQNLRHSLMWVISIGTNEIQRSLIAQRALGLPR